MYCEFCGTSMEEGAVACSVCGNARRSADEHAVRVKVAEPPSSFVIDGPRCPTHEGMPLVGKCPRCGKDVCIRCAPDAATDNLTCTDCKGMTRSHQQAPAGAKCAVHPDNLASFICSRCGSFACASCRALTLSSEGMCAKCGDAQGLVMASRGDRFVAYLVDNFVLFVPAMIATVAGVLVQAKATKGDLPVLVYVFGGAGVLIGALAELAAQMNWGQSIGKRLVKIKVLRRSGAPIELWRIILLRNLAIAAVSQLCGLIGLIDALMIFSSDQRCLHDYFADSMVVDVSQPS